MVIFLSIHNIMDIYKKDTVLSLCKFSYAWIFLVLFVCFHFIYFVY